MIYLSIAAVIFMVLVFALRRSLAPPSITEAGRLASGLDVTAFDRLASPEFDEALASLMPRKSVARLQRERRQVVLQYLGEMAQAAGALSRVAEEPELVQRAAQFRLRCISAIIAIRLTGRVRSGTRVLAADFKTLQPAVTGR